MTLDLFENFAVTEAKNEKLAPGALVLRQFALPYEKVLLNDLAGIIAMAPFRNMKTRGGYTMTVSMTSCGKFGWVSDESCYRYAETDPDKERFWPGMPDSFLDFAGLAAREAGFEGFKPDACLINRYVPGAKLGLHQDKDERDLRQPIVSVSLGIPATFLFGGFKRSAPISRIYLSHGDVVVWGGPSRLRYHGILPLKDNYHSILGKQRINLTFRKTG